MDITKSLVKNLLNNQKLRQGLVSQSHLLFFHTYFPHYIKYGTADFQKEIFKITEDEKIDTAVIVAFRGSGKTTIVNMSYPIWAVIGKLQKKFVVLLSKTQQQAQLQMKNIKNELENNIILKLDLGPFEETNYEWKNDSIYIPKYGAKIICASTEQSIRGIRHQQYRPDLIICDDIEDIESVRSRDSRDKIYRWLTGDVIPAGDRNTKLIVIGNLLHQDSLIMRFKDDIVKNRRDGLFKEYPLINEEGECLWAEKYHNDESLKKEERKIGNRISWKREYLLQIVPEDDQIIQPEWIQYYDSIPPYNNLLEFEGISTSVDLAISEKESADYTAMVSARVYTRENNERDDEHVLYILPNPINKRMNHLDTIQMIYSLNNEYRSQTYEPMFYIEQVAYQSSVIEDIKRKSIACKGCIPKGDKSARLRITVKDIMSGRVLFPRQGAEKLIDQLVNFGVEKYDDLADAFSMLVAETIDNRPASGYFYSGR